MSTECRSFRSLNATEQCFFAKNNSDCALDDGFIEYFITLICFPQTADRILFLVLVAVWYVFLFIALGITADGYFCPSLEVIANRLHLSQNVAGVTFMAFGNGATDIFSAISAVQSIRDGDAGLVLGALIGAGILVTTVVVGAVSITKPFRSIEGPLLKDIIFYLAALYWTFTIIYSGKIRLFDAVGYLALYIVYVLVTIFAPRLCSMINCTPTLANIQGDDRAAAVESLLNSESSQIDELERPANELTPLLASSSNSHYASRRKEFYQCFVDVMPVSREEWMEQSKPEKTFTIIKAPITVILSLLIPIVHCEEGKEGWSKYLNTWHCIATPCFCVVATRAAFIYINGVFPVGVLVLLLSVILAIVVFCTSRTDEPPRYHFFFALLGFVGSIIATFCIANEIVNIMETVGIYFNISSAILGLTFLAWGNSLGDLVADVTMAKQGYPGMALSAGFGGPLFNLLLGIGIPFTMKIVQSGGSPEKVNHELVSYALCIGLSTSLIFSLLWMVGSKFRANKIYGAILVVIYTAFLVCAILIESNVF